MNTRPFVYVVRAAVGLALLSQPVIAQSLRLEPSLELSTGNAFGSGGIFRDRHLDGGGRVAAGLRLLRPGSFGVFVDAVGDALDMAGVRLSDCPPSPRGGCLHSYPRFVGVSVLAGVLGQPNSAVEWRAAIGGGAYTGDRTTVGAFVAQADVGIFPFSHFGGFAGARAIVIPRFRHDRLGMIPWMIGVRLR